MICDRKLPAFLAQVDFNFRSNPWASCSASAAMASITAMTAASSSGLGFPASTFSNSRSSRFSVFDIPTSFTAECFRVSLAASLNA